MRTVTWLICMLRLPYLAIQVILKKLSDFRRRKLHVTQQDYLKKKLDSFDVIRQFRFFNDIGAVGEAVEYSSFLWHLPWIQSCHCQLNETS